jgi:hypothetical protein
MKRKDFDPKGKRNQEKRGLSGYERISWDEALDIVSGEIKRVRDQYGGPAITGITSSHHNWGIVGYKMGPFGRFMNMFEYTPVMDNPDSWGGSTQAGQENNDTIPTIIVPVGVTPALDYYVNVVLVTTVDVEFPSWGRFSDVFIEGTPAVPEPSTMLLLGSGLFGLWGARKKFKK